MIILMYSRPVALAAWPIGTITTYKYYNNQWKQDTSKSFTMMFWFGGNSAQPKNKTGLIAFDFIFLAEENTY